MEDNSSSSKDSQVGWRDGAEADEDNNTRTDLKKIETQGLGQREGHGDMAQGESVAMETMDSVMCNNLTDIMEGGGHNQPPAKEVAKPKVFLVSSWGDREPSVAGACEQLGGASLGQAGQFYDEAVTHMLATKVSRSEKMLASVAAGKWILHPSFVVDSVRAGRWVEETRYEWGNQDNDFIPNKDSMEWKLAAAARKWRLEEGQSLEGCKFILHMPENKCGPFSR